MKTLTNKTYMSSTGRLYMLDETSNLADARIQKHENLLSQVIVGFGFNNIEAREILREVSVQANKQSEHYPGDLPFKLWLSKILVRKCIFKLSSDYFSGPQNALLHPQAIERLSPRNSIFTSRHKQMPLSFWTVYLLYNHIGFSAAEIAEILNTNPLTVRERLSKALKYLARN